MQSPNISLSGLNELKGRLWFLLGALFIHRLGSHIPVPAINPASIAEMLAGRQAGILGLFNLFSGGALSRFSVFALGIMPYISASIIIQLMTVVLPYFEQLKKEGQSGRRRLTQYTRYLTLLLGSFQSFGMAKFMQSSAIITGPSYYLIVISSLLAGTMFLMWLGEQITEKGVGNGISMLIFAGIVVNLPNSIMNTIEQVRQGALHPISVLVLLAMLVVVIAAIVYIERGQRRITVNYPKRQEGRKMFAAQKSHLPLKINMAGVIPPIFASSVILFPTTISQLFADPANPGMFARFAAAISPGQPLYVALFAAAVVFFSFFYTALMFNPKETADNLKKSGGFVPGIRPGLQTANYIDKVMTRLTIVGAIYIATISLMPEFLVMFMRVPFYFGGTSLLILVVVVMDFMAQVQTHLMSHQYEGLMKKSGLKI